MGVAKSVKRRSALAAALASTADGETITIDEMMLLWGVSKGTFVNTRNLIPFFPEASFVGDRGVINYPRRESLEALIKWETRGDEGEKTKSARLRKMMGHSDDDDAESIISMSDMAKASQLRAQIEERMVVQRELVSRADEQKTAARVFEILSRNLSRLGSVIDPNGREKPEVRARLDQNGSNLLLALHREMATALGDVDVGSIIAAANRGGSGKSGKSGPSGKRRRSMADPLGHAPAKRRSIDKPVGNRTPANKRDK